MSAVAVDASRRSPGGPALCAAALALVLLALLARPAPAEPARPGAADAGLEEVMHLLAASGGVRSAYREWKHLALLSEPLESAGTLWFEPPDHLARHVESPGRAWLVVRGHDVLMRDPTGEQRADLGTSETARGLVEGLAVVLRGDLAGLRERYRVDFEGGGDGGEWRMELVPRSRAVRRLVERLSIAGSGALLHRMEMHERGGDRTRTEFTRTETGLRFTPEERARIFLLPEPAASPGDAAR